MSIEIPAELEGPLKAEAGRLGLDPATYTENLLRQSLSAMVGVRTISAEESRLLREINEGLSLEENARFRRLVQKRQEGTITPEEFRELEASTRSLEHLQVRRMEKLAELAKLRGVPLAEVITSLQIGASDVL